MHPPLRFEALRSVLLVIAVVIFAFPLCAIALLFLLLCLPYMAVYSSANFGLPRKDWPVVQRYLSLFESLHPNLMAHISRYYSSRTTEKDRPQHAIRFWPMMSREHDIEGIPLILMIHTTSHTFSVGAGLFWNLEAAGFPRRSLYEFLRNEVESSVSSLTEEDKREFQNVMDRVCNHNLLAKVSRGTTGSEEGFTLPQDVQIEKVATVRNCSLDWIVNESATAVVPMDWPSYRTMQNLCYNFPVYRAVKKDADTAGDMGNTWQMIDLR